MLPSTRGIQFTLVDGGYTMNLSAKEAAKLVGMTKAGIIKAIVKGTISAEKDVHGQWKIDPAELLRVYTPVSQGNDNQSKQVDTNLPLVDSGLQAQVDLLRKQIEDLRADKDDLRSERDKLLKLLEEQTSSVKMLSDQRQEKTVEGRGFWQRLIGK